MKRRDFIRSGAVAAAFHNFPYHLYAGTKKQATDRVKLGPMKVELSRLAMGPGRTVRAAVPIRRRSWACGSRGPVPRGFDQGVTFWDTADQYGTHPHARSAEEDAPGKGHASHQDARVHRSRDERRISTAFAASLGRITSTLCCCTA